MASPLRGVSTNAVTALAVLASCMMAALLLKAPHTFMSYLAISTPLVFVFALWNSYRALSGTLETMNVGRLKTGERLGYISLHERASIVAIFGLAGITIALSMGFVLGRMSAY